MAGEKKRSCVTIPDTMHMAHRLALLLLALALAASDDRDFYNYIVVLKPEYRPDLRAYADQMCPTTPSVLRIVGGFTCRLALRQYALVEADPRVQYAERDGPVAGSAAQAELRAHPPPPPRRFELPKRVVPAGARRVATDEVRGEPAAVDLSGEAELHDELERALHSRERQAGQKQRRAARGDASALAAAASAAAGGGSVPAAARASALEEQMKSRMDSHVDRLKATEKARAQQKLRREAAALQKAKQRATDAQRDGMHEERIRKAKAAAPAVDPGSVPLTLPIGPDTHGDRVAVLEARVSWLEQRLQALAAKVSEKGEL